MNRSSALSCFGALLALGFFVELAQAQNPTRVGSWPGYNRRTLLSVAVSGDLVYATGWHGGLQIIDVSDPAAPFPVSGYNPNGDLPYPQATANNVAVSGDFAYVVFGSSAGRKGMHVVDVSDPERPIGKSKLYNGINCVDVAVSGGVAVVAAESAGLLIADVSHPAAPVVRKNFNTTGTARGVAIAGQFAYVADGTAGLQIIDISDPQAPARVGGLDTSGEAYDVAVEGPYAYVADRAAGLQVIDVSDPAAPVRAGGYNTPGDAYGVAVSGSIVYVADGASGLQVIDVSDPAAPRRVGGSGYAIQLEPFGGSAKAGNVAISGSHVFIAQQEDGDGGIEIIDVSNPASPQREGYYGVASTSSLASASGRLYVADLYLMHVLDLTDPARPRRIGGVKEGVDRIVGVAFDHAYVRPSGRSGTQTGVLVIDVSDPTQAKSLGRYGEGQYFGSMSVHGRYAYTTVWDPVPRADSRVLILDLSNPAEPTVAGVYDPDQAVGGRLVFSGHFAFLGGGESGLHVLDVSNPALPARVAELNLGGYTEIAGMVGSRYLIMVRGGSTLEVVDVSDPLAPRRVKTLPFPDSIHDAAVVGNFVVLTLNTYGNGFRVIDVSDPTLPVTKWMLPTPPNSVFYPEQIAVSGEYAYCSNDYAGVAIVRIPALAAPPLGIESAVEGVRLSWPLSATAWTLETAEALDPSSGWVPVPPPYPSDTNGWFFTAPTTPVSQYFRLVRP